MKAHNSQSGFSIAEVGLVVIIIAIIGFLGYTFYSSQMDKTASNDNSQTSSEPAIASDVTTAPAISSVADLDLAQATLDQTDPGGSNSSDTSQLDAELGNF